MREAAILFVHGRDCSDSSGGGGMFAGDRAAQGTPELESCLDTFVLDLNSRSVTEEASPARTWCVLA